MVYDIDSKYWVGVGGRLKYGPLLDVCMVYKYTSGLGAHAGDLRLLHTCRLIPCPCLFVALV